MAPRNKFQLSSYEISYKKPFSYSEHLRVQAPDQRVGNRHCEIHINQEVVLNALHTFANNKESSLNVPLHCVILGTGYP